MKLSATQYRNALTDLKDSLAKYKLWVYLGWSDIKQRYRGSILGPFWITISMVIFIVALGIVYSRLFHQELRQLIPFLTCGILVWTFIASTIVESSDVFVNSKTFIDNINLPYLIYIFRLVWRNIIVFLHNLIVYIFIVLFFKIKITWSILLFIPGLFLVSTILASASVLISMIGTRFRDIPPVINSIITVIFFISPITWHQNLIGEQSLIIKLNPVNYLLDVVRPPLLGETPTLQSWYYCILLAIFTFVLAFTVFSQYRRRIPFWI